jgi:putative transposase
LISLEWSFDSLRTGKGNEGMIQYAETDNLLRPVLQIAMPRAPRIYAPGATVHVVARCNNREFYFTTPEDFEVLLDHLHEMGRTYGVTIFAYTLMSNHIHLLLQSPQVDALGRPLRWFMTETAKTFHRLRNRRGHFWERRYHACLVEDDLYVLAALRYMDRNPVRAGIVEEPATYAWSSCAGYALGAANGLIAFHPSYLGLSPYAKVRQRNYRAILTSSSDPHLYARDSRWTSQRAVGSLDFLKRHHPSGRKRGIIPLPEQIRKVGK